MATSPGIPLLSERENSHSSSHRRRRDGCTECRRKKVKCDMHQPVCSRCQRYPRGCRYDLKIIDRMPVRQRPQAKSDHASLVELATSATSCTRGARDQMKFVRQPLLNDSPFLFSEESRFLMHIFATQTAQMLFPAAPEFFLRRMISVAMERPHLLYALLASSCSHHGRLVRDSSRASRVILLKYTNLAISGLREALLDPEQVTKAETVTTAMALCTNDVCNGDMDVGRAHLRGVLRLLMTFLEHQRMSHHKMNDTYVQCLVKWFKSMDVLAALSGVHGECIHRPGSGALDQLSDHTSWHVDCISGYSLRLMPILARISKLVKEVRHLAHGTVRTDCALPRGIRVQAEELEMELYQFLGPRTSNNALSCGGSVAFELRCSHFAFVHAALLHLHRRVQLLPKAHIKVRTDVANILDILRFIEPDSSINVLLLWPVFSAGCETEECEVQVELFTRMGHMQDRGMGNFTRARQVLRQYWTFGSHLPWDLHLEQLGLQLILF